MKSILAVAFVVLSSVSVWAVADNPTKQPVPAHADDWRIWGGESAFRWNRSLLSNYGIEIQPLSGTKERDARDYERLNVGEQTTLDFRNDPSGFAGFIRGSLALQGGFNVIHAKGTIALREPRLAAHAGDPFRLDLVDSHGTAWFYVDRLMYEIEGGPSSPTLMIKASDLRVAKALARKFGAPQLQGMAVANLKLASRIQVEGRSGTPHAPQAAARWPGTPVAGQSGATYQADVFMYYFDTQIMREGVDHFDPSAGTKIVLAPSSTLRNNRNDGAQQVTVPCAQAPCGSPPPMLPDPLGSSTATYAADVAWYTKFTGPFAPYNNDQHPFLIWNLYRIDADGRIEQIGRSGVKHAWLTTNASCDSGTGNYHILGRGCVDTYSQNNNDEISDLGPRSEIIPAKGQWGRCGSVYDRDCDGNDDGLSTPCSNIGGGGEGCRNWAFRLAVHEDEIDPSLNPGATYWVESWYVVRDDVNIYNTMQTRALSFAKNAGNWTSVDAPSDDAITGLKLGPAIDRWLARGTASANARSTDIDTANGRGRVAVKVTALGDGRWRYDYVVSNFDYAVAELQGTEPNLRVVSNVGFTAFEVQTDAATALQSPVFSDGDRNPSNDWTLTTTASLLRWETGSVGSPPTSTHGLNWGGMFRFSFETSNAPVAGVLRLRDGDGQYIVLQSLVPSVFDPDAIFPDGFELGLGN
jgi:hypothetical protein